MHGENGALQAQFLEENLGKIKNKIVVMSGKGGVGKSTVSVNLAYGLALQGKKVGLLDVDLHGPSLARMTGIEGKSLSRAEDGRILPMRAHGELYVLTVASLLENPEDPVIWRGPAKMGAIKQFLAEVAWPELDYMIIDCPPGTGDEPLSVIQLLKDVTGSVIVSTPQDVALIDVRKSIRFSQKLDVPVLGLIENMSGLTCPHCSETIDLFKRGGAERAAIEMDINVLGKIPLEPMIVDSGDDGKPFVYHYAKTDSGKVMQQIAETVIALVEV